MKRNALALVMLVCLLALPVAAGEVNTPGAVSPPPPSSATTLTVSMRQIALDVILSLIRH